MVAMGSSFSDGAWGRESAVYRLSGVLTIISGWFLTAFIALVSSFLMAIFIYYGGYFAILVLILLLVFLISKSNSIFRKKKEHLNFESSELPDTSNHQNIIDLCNETVRKTVINLSKYYFLTILNFSKENRKKLYEFKKEIKDFSNETELLKKNLLVTIRKLEDNELESGHYYVQVLDYIREASNCLQYIISPIFNHIDNNQPPLPKEQAEELLYFNEQMTEFFNFSLNILKNLKFESIGELSKLKNNIIILTNNLKRKQIQYLKKSGKGSKVSLLFLDIMTESKNMVSFVCNIVEAHKDFIEHSQKTN
jgi:Na+/phosphate symporter